jgi:hypothetical protein
MQLLLWRVSSGWAQESVLGERQLQASRSISPAFAIRSASGYAARNVAIHASASVRGAAPGKQSQNVGERGHVSMSPVGALLAAFNQLFFFIHAVRGIVQDPVLQFTASIFDFRKDDVLSLHPGLDACRGNGNS